MLKWLKAHWNNSLTLATALVLALLLVGSALYVQRIDDISAAAQAVKWSDKVNVAGALTAADGITVTAGGVDFPASAVALVDVNFPSANIVTVCASGCQYIRPRAALAGNTGTEANPVVVLVMPGTYTETSNTIQASYEYVIGFGQGISNWVLSNKDLHYQLPGGLFNLSISGGSSSNVLIEADTVGSGMYRIHNCEVTNDTTTGVALYVIGPIEIRDSTLIGGMASALPSVYIQEATFSAYGSIITSATHDAVAIGASGTTMFRDCQITSQTAYAIQMLDALPVLDVYQSVLWSGGAEAIHAASPITGTVCLSPMNKALDVDFNNDCVNPGNPTIP